MTGIALEKDLNRPFVVSLADGLPEEIRRDDVKALREEWEMFMNAYGFSGDGAYMSKAIQTDREIKIRLAQAQAAGFDTKGW